VITINNTITVSKEELCEVLQVTSKALQHIITRDTLKGRLNEVGYKLIDAYKIGRYKAYDIEAIELKEWDILQNKHNIKKKDEHTEYTVARLYNLVSPRTKILRENNISISGTTAGRYDDILVKEQGMEKDKCVYYKTNKEGLWEEITEAYYKSFWIELREYKYIVSLYRNRLRKQEITQDAYDLVTYNLYNTIERFKGYMVVKFYTYKEAENTKKILDMINSRL